MEVLLIAGWESANRQTGVILLHPGAETHLRESRRSIVLWSCGGMNSIVCPLARFDGGVERSRKGCQEFHYWSFKFGPA